MFLKRRMIIAAVLLLSISCSDDESKKLTPDDQGEEAGAPPATWEEKWLDHRLELSLVYYDDDVAIYYDDDVDRSVTWTYKFMGDVWRYVVSVYGDFGTENRLYAVFHGGTYSGGRTGNIFDEATSYRSLSDVTSGDWSSMSGWNIDAHVHEVGHVVEGSSHGVHESPAFDIWKDSKWAEIFQYDVYKGLGMDAEADRIYQLYINGYDDFPRENTYWFRDWFYPIYDQYGEASVLNKFFELLAAYFPKTSNGDKYARRMNWGEFVHFWSGAAGTDLKPLAEEAFGWSDEWDDQLYTAKIEYDKITY